MRKIALLVGVLAAVAAPRPAPADEPRGSRDSEPAGCEETVRIVTSLSIKVCTDEGENSLCSIGMLPIGPGTPIELKPAGGGGEPGQPNWQVCQGEWGDAKTEHGHTFRARLEVLKWVFDGAASYSISGTVYDQEGRDASVSFGLTRMSELRSVSLRGTSVEAGRSRLTPILYLGQPLLVEPIPIEPVPGPTFTSVPSPLPLPSPSPSPLGADQPQPRASR